MLAGIRHGLTGIAILTGIAGPSAAAAAQGQHEEILAANERAAIAALREIAAAQERIRHLGAIDTDADGVGEYAYLGELAGSAPLRIIHPRFGWPTVGTTPLTPPLLPQGFRNLWYDYLGEIVLSKDGYLFKLFLPDPRISHNVAGVPETGGFGIGGAVAGWIPDADRCESLWACYAWPMEAGVTGGRAFFINQEGVLLETPNDPRSQDRPIYEFLTPAGMPTYHAAYSVHPATPDGTTGMGAPLGIAPRRANDGNRWTPVVVDLGVHRFASRP